MSLLISADINCEGIYVNENQKKFIQEYIDLVTDALKHDGDVDKNMKMENTIRKRLKLVECKIIRHCTEEFLDCYIESLKNILVKSCMKEDMDIIIMKNLIYELEYFKGKISQRTNKSDGIEKDGLQIDIVNEK